MNKTLLIIAILLSSCSSVSMMEEEREETATEQTSVQESILFDSEYVTRLAQDDEGYYIIYPNEQGQQIAIAVSIATWLEIHKATEYTGQRLQGYLIRKDGETSFTLKTF